MRHGMGQVAEKTERENFDIFFGYLHEYAVGHTDVQHLWKGAILFDKCALFRPQNGHMHKFHAIVYCVYDNLLYDLAVKAVPLRTKSFKYYRIVCAPKLLLLNCNASA
jgi:hypothetical protein